MTMKILKPLIEMGYEENDESLIPEIQEMLDEFVEEFEQFKNQNSAFRRI